MLNNILRELKKFYWWKVFIIILVPFLLCIWIFFFPWNVEFESALTQTVDFASEKVEKIKYSESDSEKLTKNFLSEVLNIPLDFKTIRLCFENIGTYYEYESSQGLQRKYPSFLLQLTNKKNHTVNTNETKCETVGIGDKFTPSIFIKNLDLEPDAKVDVKPDGRPFVKLDFVKTTKLFGKKNLIEVIEKSSIFILSWMAICLLFIKIWGVVRKMP